jgi:hypothetical membrane protein
VLCGLATAIFYPLTECLRWGQLSIALTFAFTLFLWCVRRRHFFSAGLNLVLLSVKPHLFFLLVVPGLLWLMQLEQGERRSLLVGVISGAGLVLVGITFLWPEAVQWWLASLGHSPTAPGATPMEKWLTATASSWIRLVLQYFTGTMYRWPMWLVSVLTLGATAWYFFLKRPTVRWEIVAPPVMCLSLLCGSYGWLYDQTLLLVVNLRVFSQVLEWRQPSARRRGMALLILVNLLVWGVAALPHSKQHYFAWVPLAFLALWWWSERVASVLPSQRTPTAAAG